MDCIFYILLSLIGIIFLFILFTIFCSFAVRKDKEYTKDSKLYRFLLNIWSAIVIRFARIKFEYSGLENIPSDCNFLIVGNHRSNFDPIITCYALRKYPIAFVSKGENFKIPFFGRIIRKCCFMEIDRENPRNAMRTINRATELLKNCNLSVGIYPEGTRNKTEELLLPFHNGVFKIAQKSNVPIVVITLINTEKIAKNFPLRSTKVRVEVSKVIPADLVTACRTTEISEMVEKSICKSYEYNS